MKKKTIYFILFILYLSAVLKLTIFRTGFYHDERQMNLHLFVNYKNMEIGQFIWLFFGNIGWFIPFGLLLPVLLKRKSFGRVVVSGFLFSLIIESLQFFFRKGVAELDDLILNTLGVVIGYFLYKWLKKSF